MKRIIIDANILFSALRSKNSKTRNRILNETNQYYCPNFIILEIFKHRNSIFKYSQSSEEEILNYLSKVLSKIHFINEDNIATANFIKAFNLCKEVDAKDTPFVALSLELSFELWTRDKELKNHLIKKGFNNFFEE